MKTCHSFVCVTKRGSEHGLTRTAKIIVARNDDDLAIFVPELERQNFPPNIPFLCAREVDVRLKEYESC